MPKNKLPKITDQSDLKGKRVFVRMSLNVPVENGVVMNQFRLMRGLATVTYLVNKEAKVIIAGHIGRNPKDSLQPVYEALARSIAVTFTGDVGGTASKEIIADMKNGEIVLLENLRQDAREKENDPAFAAELAELADLYVNDAFADSHREHASIVGVPALLPAYAGLNFVHEFEELQKAAKPKSPSLFLLGGAKFETKMPLVAKYLEIYDKVFIGGALANDFFKAKGYEVGESLVSDIDLSNSAILKHPKILLPTDVTVMSERGVRVTTTDSVEKDEKILDVGPATISALQSYTVDAKLILWNGPLGNYELGFNTHTKECARIVAESDGYSVVGGGDTIAAIESLNIQEKFNFLSTAGGAMLTFLEAGTLPGIESLLQK